MASSFSIFRVRVPNYLQGKSRQTILMHSKAKPMGLQRSLFHNSPLILGVIEENLRNIDNSSKNSNYPSLYMSVKLKYMTIKLKIKENSVCGRHQKDKNPIVN